MSRRRCRSIPPSTRSGRSYWNSSITRRNSRRHREERSEPPRHRERSEAIQIDRGTGLLRSLRELAMTGKNYRRARFFAFAFAFALGFALALALRCGGRLAAALRAAGAP